MERVVGITTINGEEVSFDPPGASVKDKTLYASVKKTPYEVPLNQVQRLWVERKELSKSRTIGLVAAVAVGTLAIIVGVAAATKQSCPFVYSWDGKQPVFDAEPYGGAITRGLEKDDFSALERLREQDGLYQLKITNEVATRLSSATLPSFGWLTTPPELGWPQMCWEGCTQWQHRRA